MAMGQDVTVRTRSGSFNNDYVTIAKILASPAVSIPSSITPPNLKAIQKFERVTTQQFVPSPAIGKIVLNISNEGQQPARDIWIQISSQLDPRGIQIGKPPLIRLLRGGEAREIEVPIRSSGPELPRQILLTIEISEGGGYNLYPPLRAVITPH